MLILSITKNYMQAPRYTTSTPMLRVLDRKKYLKWGNFLGSNVKVVCNLIHQICRDIHLEYQQGLWVGQIYYLELTQEYIQLLLFHSHHMIQHLSTLHPLRDMNYL